MSQLLLLALSWPAVPCHRGHDVFALLHRLQHCNSSSGAAQNCLSGVETPQRFSCHARHSS